MKEAVIVSAVRTPIGRSHKGSLINLRMDDLGALVVKEAVKRANGLNPNEIEDVIVGCAFPEGIQGMNVARLIGLLSGLPTSVPGTTVNRFCGSSAEAICTATRNIMTDNGDIFVSAGIESMTQIPMGGYNPSFNQKFFEGGLPQAYIPMGLTAENLVEKYKISREDQDKFALESHLKAVKATNEGKFKNEILPITVTLEDGSTKVVDKDDCPRGDTSMEALAKLKPAFKGDGTVTAGNSSPLNDGAAAVVLMSKEKAKSLGLKPLGTIRAMAVAGVEPEIMGIGPVPAVKKALKRAGLKLNDIDVIELNEAFAAQSLVVIRELGLDQSKTNPHGGAIAIGHPLGCTGARIMATLIYDMIDLNAHWGLETMCIGGGQGIAILVEREN